MVALFMYTNHVTLNASKEAMDIAGLQFKYSVLIYTE